MAVPAPAVLGLGRGPPAPRSLRRLQARRCTKPRPRSALRTHIPHVSFFCLNSGPAASPATWVLSVRHRCRCRPAGIRDRRYPRQPPPTGYSTSCKHGKAPRPGLGQDRSRRRGASDLATGRSWRGGAPSRSFRRSQLLLLLKVCVPYTTRNFACTGSKAHA